MAYWSSVFQGVTSVSQLSKDLQNLWALTVQAGSQQAEESLGRYDVSFAFCCVYTWCVFMQMGGRDHIPYISPNIQVMPLCTCFQNVWHSCGLYSHAQSLKCAPALNKRIVSYFIMAMLIQKALFIFIWPDKLSWGMLITVKGYCNEGESITLTSLCHKCQESVYMYSSFASVSVMEYVYHGVSVVIDPFKEASSPEAGFKSTILNQLILNQTH